MRYRVRLNGRNFLLCLDENGDRKTQHGFYVTRDVEAESFEDAELKAVEMLRNEEALQNSTMNERDDPPMLYLDDIRILGEHEESLNNSGFVFYPEDEGVEVVKD